MSSATLQADVLPRAAPPTASLERRCPCGGHVIGGGECAQCRARRLERERRRPAQREAAPRERAPQPVRSGRDLSAITTEGPRTLEGLRPVDPVSEGLTQMGLLLRRRSAGSPPPDAARARVEARAGRPLGPVRVHDGPAAGAAAALLGARAFTIGQDVFLGGDVPSSGPAAERVLDHELAHTLQQREWTGGRVDFDRRAGRHEPEAERVASGTSGRLAAPGPPSLMPLHPAVVALIAGELACLFGFYLYALTKLYHKGDKYLHCWTSCKIATWCPPVPLTGQAIAALIGAVKELADVVIGEAELRDMKNNLSGIACSAHYLTSCDDCCQAKLKAGELAQAPSGAGEPESELTGTEATALAREEAGSTEGGAGPAATPSAAAASGEEGRAA